MLNMAKAIDLKGKRLAYTIYDKFETTTEDTEFITRNTNQHLS